MWMRKRTTENNDLYENTDDNDELELKKNNDVTNVDSDLCESTNNHSDEVMVDNEIYSN